MSRAWGGSRVALLGIAAASVLVGCSSNSLAKTSSVPESYPTMARPADRAALDVPFRPLHMDAPGGTELESVPARVDARSLAVARSAPSGRAHAERFGLTTAALIEDTQPGSIGSDLPSYTLAATSTGARERIADARAIPTSHVEPGSRSFLRSRLLGGGRFLVFVIEKVRVPAFDDDPHHPFGSWVALRIVVHRGHTGWGVLDFNAAIAGSVPISSSEWRVAFDSGRGWRRVLMSG